jgi:hypothetical protein
VTGDIAHAPLTLEEIELARERIAGAAIRTPLVRLDAERRSSASTPTCPTPSSS